MRSAQAPTIITAKITRRIKPPTAVHMVLGKARKTSPKVKPAFLGWAEAAGWIAGVEAAITFG